MGVARLANPIFGVFARTARGRQSLNAAALHPWVRFWQEQPCAADWWIDPEGGVAFFRPECAVDGDDNSRGAALAIRGAVSRTHGSGSTQDILSAIASRGLGSIRDMRGQYALACWDGARLLLARDHLGQRAIFFRTEPDLVLFCSELAPLLRSGGCVLDRESAVWYLAFGMPAPGKTLARGVERVPAAHAVILERGQPAIRRRYWSPLSPESPREATAEVVARLRAGIENAVLEHLTPDDRPGILLSGGVDSTFLAATLAAAGAPPAAFTGEFDAHHGMNENEYASAVANWLKVPHAIVPLGAAEALELLDIVILSAAEPCSAWAALTHFKLLSCAVSCGVSRLYSGLGADEIFGGYDHMRGYYSRFLRWKRSVTPARDTDAFTALLQLETQSARRVLYPGVARFFRDTDLRQALCPPFHEWHYASELRAFYRECRQLKPEAQVVEMMVAHECQYRIPDLLMAVFEPISRRSGVELIYPFLSPEVVQLASGLSVESRYRTASGQFSLHLKRLLPRFKYTMMRVAEDRVPAEILNRPRKSYTAPFGGWLFEKDFREPVLDRLRRSRLWERELVRPEWLETILGRVVPGPNPWVFQLWALVTLAGWYDRFVEPSEN